MPRRAVMWNAEIGQPDANRLFPRLPRFFAVQSKLLPMVEPPHAVANNKEGLELESHIHDVLAIVISSALLLAYYLFLLYQARRNPNYTIHAINQKARHLWVLDIMKSKGKEILAVQTLRNLVMAATFNASSAILLILGTLTLSGQAEVLTKTWQTLNPVGPHATSWWIIKIMCLLTVLIVAFFAFAMTIRLLNHVVFMVNLPLENAHGLFSAEKIAARLNRSGAYYTIGMRAFFVAVPLVFWLFGPMFLVGATIGLVIVLYNLDRNPLTTHD